MLDLRYSAGFWIYFDLRIYQSFEYTRFLNMSGLNKVLNKIFRDICLTVFWICLEFWIYFVIYVWQYSEYALNSEYAMVLNMLGLHKVVNKTFHQRYLIGFWMCLEFWKYQYYTGFCRKQPVIHVWQVSEYSFDSQYARAWIYKGREDAKVAHSSV